MNDTQNPRQNQIVSLTDSPKFVRSLQNSAAARMEEATPMAEKILKSYPDYGKAPAEYLLAVTELLAGYPQEVRERLADLRTGIASRCKFLPSIAEIVEMAEEPQRIREQFSPPTAYKKFPPAPDYDESPEEMERRRGFIERLRRETSFMRFTE